MQYWLIVNSAMLNNIKKIRTITIIKLSIIKGKPYQLTTVAFNVKICNIKSLINRGTTWDVKTGILKR